MMSGTNEDYKNKVDLVVAYNELYEENIKLQQDKQDLIEFLKKQIETKKEYMKTDISYSVFYESDIKKLQEILEKLGE